MSYTVLARRYRSASLDQVIGQDQVARTLTRAIETGRIAHAYLFCGSRGTGKTSTARILAKCLNCLKHKEPTAHPCNKCDSCLSIAAGQDIDVIEIDAASNTGVDDVRQIIANAAFRPARARFKVYIIDEVHMLSKNAFNALLKILEEPPSHVKFILATTEPEKVLPTILSRCQRYDFRNIPTRQIAAHLKDICKQEKMAADDEALLLVAKSAAGSMRDGISLLERLLSVGAERLTVSDVEQLMGLPRAQSIFDLADVIGKGDIAAALTKSDALMNAGFGADSLLTALAEHFRDLLILRTCGASSDLLEAPAVAPADLQAQAQRFDAAALTQNIAILEELRRTLRQGYGGRPLLDATLARLAMAEQFASIGDLLNQIEAPESPVEAKPVEAQKKKPIDPAPLTVRPAAPSPPAPPPRAAPPSPAVPKPAAPALSSENRDLPAGGTATRLTPELTAELEKDPLVRAVIQQLGGRIVKVD